MPPTKKTTVSHKVTSAAAEATGEKLTFEHQGIIFSVSADPLDFPLEVLRTDDELDAISLILGKAQWAKYMETNPTIRDFGALAEKLSEVQGRDEKSGN
ncbi:hypothetical protein [Streptomyces sp. NPDC055036]